MLSSARTTYELKKRVQEASHVGDTDTALEELQRLISQKRRMGNNGNKTKEVTTFDVQVADFIRNHKKQEQQQMTKSIQVWLFLLPSMQTALKTFDNGSRCWNFYHRQRNPRCACASAEEEPELSDEDLIGSTSAKVNDPVRYVFEEIGVVPLLTNEEEKLALAVEAGDIEAKQRLAEANLRLVVSIAKHLRRGVVCNFLT